MGQPVFLTARGLERSTATPRLPTSPLCGPRRRIHEKPDLAHLVACRPWLDAEVTEVDPQLIVVLGAAAARSILGPGIKVTKQRGEILTREPAYQALVEDLRVAAVAVQA